MPQVRVEDASDLLAKIEDRLSPQGQPLLDVWMSHGDYVTALPAGFQSDRQHRNSPYAGIADIHRHFYGLQFHPEVTHTRQGKANSRAFCIGYLRLQAHLECRQYYHRQY